MDPHARQFVAGPKAWIVGPSWTSRRLGPSLHLSWHRDLPVAFGRDGDGRDWALLGIALETEPEAPDPERQLASARTTELDEIGRTWSGRWALLAGDELRLDAGGLLGGAYRVAAAGGPPRVWISSSPTLLARLPDLPHAEPVAGRLLYNRGTMDWFPPPVTGLRGVRRLMSGQILDLRTGAPRPNRGAPAARAGQPYEDALAELESRLTGAVVAAARRLGRLWVSLSAGKDSRLVLAAAHKAGVRPATYTFDKPFMRMSAADRRVPRRLAASLGYEHRLIGAGAPSEQRYERFDVHTGGLCTGVDREYVARGHWEELPPRAAVLRGGVFEVGRSFYGRRISGGDGSSAAMSTSIAEAFALDGPGDLRACQRAGVDEWVAWSMEHPDPRFEDWRDRFYLDQRVGGWLATIEQALDFTGRASLQLANCRAVLDTLMAIDPERRRGGAHQRDLIGRMAPELLEEPFNSPDGRLDRWTGRLRRECYRMRIAPTRRAYVRGTVQRAARR